MPRCYVIHKCKILHKCNVMHKGQDTSEENSRVNSPPTGKGSAHKCDVRDNTLRSNEILGQPPLPRLPLANVKHSVPGKGQSARQNSNMWAEHLCGRSLPLSGENLLDYFPLMYLGLKRASRRFLHARMQTVCPSFHEPLCAYPWL